MNRRQKKKRNKYNALISTIYSETNANVMPNNWSEIRWFIQWFKEHYRSEKNNA